MSGQPVPASYYGAPAWGPSYQQPKMMLYEQPTGHKRPRLNVLSVCTSVLVPWLLFMIVFGLLSFHLHFNRPLMCWFSVLVVFLFVLMTGVFALRAWRKKKAESIREPTWFIFLFVTCSLAWVFAVGLGLWNWSSMLPHYEMVALNTYTNVDVAEISGSGVMDAGRLSFKAGSYIDTSKAMGFKKVDTYCVAPVTSGKLPLLTYDFWAVGVNCCSGEPGDFHCGEVKGHLELGSGARVLSNAELPWLTLATQQAEAFHHLRVGHAIFFTNVADPLGTESTEMDAGVKFFCLCSMLFFGWQFSLVTMMILY